MRIERGEHISYPPKFEDIEVWQLARELTRKVYGLTKKAKFVRDFGNPEPLNPYRKVTLNLRTLNL